MPNRSKSPKRRTPTPSKKVVLPKKQGGGSSLPVDEQSCGTISVSTTTVLVVLVLAVLAIIVYLAYNRSQDEVAATKQSQQTAPSMLTSSNKNQSSTEKMEDIPPIPDPITLRRLAADAENINEASFWGNITAKNYERLINPLLPPERSYENTYGIPVNIPSRGFSGGFQQVGYLYKKDVAKTDVPVGQDPNSVIIPLYGRPLWPGANKWNYYLNSDKFHAVKMPFQVKGRSSDDDHGIDELHDKDEIELPAYNGKFEVTIYNYDKPRYIPFLY